MSGTAKIDRDASSVVLSPQRKTAITAGGAFDHVGRVRIKRMADFDMSRTIFGGLTGIARKFMDEKLAKEVVWDATDVAQVDQAYDRFEAERPVAPIDQRLIDFMNTECDFSMEHADGSFLEHLVFCHHYAARYYPEHSPNVALLHSILGTATNTFAMKADKLPRLKSLLTPFEATHVEAFPSILRLLYNSELLEELQSNMTRIDQLKAVRFNRVIDNEPIEITAQNFWINLNYHLMHFVDFMPGANWATHRADPLMQMFEAVSDLLDRAGQRQAEVKVSFPTSKAAPVDESRTTFGRVTGLLPGSFTLKLARKSINAYSEQIGHSLDYQLDWRGAA